VDGREAEGIGAELPMVRCSWQQAATCCRDFQVVGCGGEMSFRLCNAPASFQRCTMVIFSDLIEKVMEVFMDDFSVYGKTFND
jgi:hypothetical protein